MELHDDDGCDDDDPTVGVMLVYIVCFNMQVCLASLLSCHI